MLCAKLVFCTYISTSFSKKLAELQYIDFLASQDLPSQACAHLNEDKTLPQTWCKDEQLARIHVPWGGSPRQLRLMPGLLRREAAALLRLSKTLEPSAELDSVDRQPSHEIILMFKQQLHPHFSSEVRQVLEPVQRKLLPYIQFRYKCKECVICTVFLRHYKTKDGRRKHPLHFDQNAYITAVVGLNPEEFSGGLYVQEGEDAKSRHYIRLARGDVLLHQFDVRHGVQVQSGERHSAIFWIKDDAQSCSANTSPWYLKSARTGDADAQANIARMYRKGEGGVAQNLSAAFKWYSQAAVHGHPVAEYYLARLLHDNNSLPQNDSAALHWAKRAAENGHAGAQVLFGAMLEEGKGGAVGGAAAAEPWYLRSAKQENPWGMYSIGRVYLLGAGGVARKFKAGKRWISKAAAAGYHSAKVLQEQLATMGAEL